jgi:hypothetical protein
LFVGAGGEISQPAADLLLAVVKAKTEIRTVCVERREREREREIRERKWSAHVVALLVAQ